MGRIHDSGKQNSGLSFTADQQKCIDLRQCDLLVSAAAGSGKTAVLVERIIQIICDPEHPVDIDRLLVVTFTKAAAAQMREKIAAAIARKLLEHPGQEHLERQAALLHNAQITTIDSFCLFVIRNNFADIGLDPGFRVGDENEMKLFRADVLEQVLEQCYRQEGENFLYLADTFAKGTNDKPLYDIVMKLYTASRSHPFPAEWLSERENDYNSQLPVEETPWFEEAKKQIRILIHMCLSDCERCRKLCQEPDGPHRYGAIADGEAELFQRVLARLDRAESYAQLRELTGMFTFGRLPAIKKEDAVNEDKKERFKSIRDGVKARVKTVELEYLVCSPERLLEQTAICERVVRELVRVTHLFAEAYGAAKRDKNLLDFSDMEHLALKILSGPTALEYRKHFQYVMIDEYQDSNLVQEYLLGSIAGQVQGEFNRFMVGDVKQSIYKFRLARPEIFLEKYHSFSGTDRDHVRVDLRRNFRSRPEVLEAVNDIFKKIMRQEVGGISYDDASALYPGAVYPEAYPGEMKAEVILCAAKEGEKAEEAVRREAYAAAVKIRELVKNGRVSAEKPKDDTSVGPFRPVEYRDIVILLRSVSGIAEVYADVLEHQGIPVFVTSRTGYFGAQEVRTLLQLLQIISNPLQDIPFYGVLHSCIGAFEDHEIAWIRSRDPEKKRTLYEDCVAWQSEHAAESNEAEQCSPELQELTKTVKLKLDVFLDKLQRFREYASYMTVQELLRRVLTQTDYLILITAMTGGDKRLANVEMLLQKAAEFEKTSYSGLYDFVRYMEQLERYEVDFGEANTLGQQDNVVRIMTIHASKGLEFPVCFVSSLHRPFNLKDRSASFLIDTDLGVGMKCIDLKRRAVSNTMRRKVLSQKIAWDDMAEELRILYVALTRAKEKLIITGVCRYGMTEETEEHLSQANAGVLCDTEPGTGHLPLEKILSAGSMLDWIMMSYDAASRFSVRLVKPEELLMEEAADILNQESVKTGFLEECRRTQPDEGLMAALKRAEQQTYHHADLRNLHTKTSVSELKKAAMQETDEAAYELFEQKEVVPYLPKFIRQQEDVSGTDRGNAYHKFMELFDFKLLYEAEPDRDMVCREMNRMLAEGLLAEDYAAILQPKKLLAFLRSPAAGRMAKAAVRDCLYREQPFVMGVEASRLDAKYPAGETVLIQGIIDVFWEEEGKYILLDYKTDRVEHGRELVARYRAQMDYYEEALSKMRGTVSEKIIYSFGLLEEIMV